MKEPVLLWDNNSLPPDLKARYVVPPPPKEDVFLSSEELPGAANYIYLGTDTGLGSIINRTREEE